MVFSWSIAIFLFSLPFLFFFYSFPFCEGTIYKDGQGFKREKSGNITPIIKRSRERDKESNSFDHDFELVDMVKSPKEDGMETEKEKPIKKKEEKQRKTIKEIEREFRESRERENPNIFQDEDEDDDFVSIDTENGDILVSIFSGTSLDNEKQMKEEKEKEINKDRIEKEKESHQEDNLKKMSIDRHNDESVITSESGLSFRKSEKLLSDESTPKRERSDEREVESEGEGEGRESESYPNEFSSIISQDKIIGIVVNSFAKKELYKKRIKSRKRKKLSGKEKGKNENEMTGLIHSKSEGYIKPMRSFSYSLSSHVHSSSSSDGGGGSSSIDKGDKDGSDKDKDFEMEIEGRKSRNSNKNKRGKISSLPRKSMRKTRSMTTMSRNPIFRKRETSPFIPFPSKPIDSTSNLIDDIDPLTFQISKEPILSKSSIPKERERGSEEIGQEMENSSLSKHIEKREMEAEEAEEETEMDAELESNIFQSLRNIHLSKIKNTLSPLDIPSGNPFASREKTLDFGKKRFLLSSSSSSIGMENSIISSLLHKKDLSISAESIVSKRGESSSLSSHIHDRDHSNPFSLDSLEKPKRIKKMRKIKKFRSKNLSKKIFGNGIKKKKIPSTLQLKSIRENIEINEGGDSSKSSLIIK